MNQVAVSVVRGVASFARRGVSMVCLSCVYRVSIMCLSCVYRVAVVWLPRVSIAVIKQTHTHTLTLTLTHQHTNTVRSGINGYTHTHTHTHTHTLTHTHTHTHTPVTWGGEPPGDVCMRGMWWGFAAGALVPYPSRNSDAMKRVIGISRLCMIDTR